MFKSIAAQTRREDGQTMAEYGVVLAVIAVLTIAAFTFLSQQISAAINAVAALLGVGP